MAQETVVVKLARPEGARLRARLEGGAFTYRRVPHAEFSVMGEGVVATLYTSGKLVVQGADAAAFVTRYLQGEGRVRPAKASSGGATGDLVPADGPLVGSDECGKGDYFGPLVVCAVRVPREQRAGLAGSEVADSKRLSDEAVLRLAGPLEATFEHRIERLDPEEYNRAHAAAGNLNELLADLHARAIRPLARDGDAVLIDRFAAARLMAGRLKGLAIDLRQEVRAEREPVVAAASILARAAFLDRLRELSEEFAVDLHKGAGAPTDRAGRRFLALHGEEALGRVAKLHFKNTAKILRARG